MDQKVIIAIVIVVLVLIGGYFLLQPATPVSVVQDTNQEAATTTPENTATENTINVGADVQLVVGKNYDVVYTDSGYSPSTLTIKVGDTVTWKNESSGGNWVGSAMHPDHMLYSGTALQQHCPDTANNAFDECKADKPGESWSFTFKKAGSWGYHNHVNAKFFGKIIVE